jgi:AmpD protein
MPAMREITTNKKNDLKKTLPLIHINLETGLIEGARQCPSPNHDARSSADDMSLIVIHNISLPPNEYGGDGIDQLFTNTIDKGEHPFYEEIYKLRVSSHLLIRRDGEMVQYVPFHKRAWHAGVSQFLGRDVCNDFSIGIEMEGTDFEVFTEDQYEVLNKVIASLLASYPSLSEDAITGHEHIAEGRKTDPGPFFKWQKLSDQFGVKLPAKCQCKTD